MIQRTLFSLLHVGLLVSGVCQAFTPSSMPSIAAVRNTAAKSNQLCSDPSKLRVGVASRLKSSGGDDNNNNQEGDDTDESLSTQKSSSANTSTCSKQSLQEKMKKWEASEEEVRAATLGGIVPGGKERSDAFDVGLYIAFPIMVLSGLAFAIFPLIMGNLDVDSVGPPPTV